MLNNSILDEDTKWMRSASEDDLRDFVRILDANESHPRHKFLLDAFDKECNRRAAKNYEERSGGEWI